MAGVLRSPQFSEETAWLPPWLQPHRPGRVQEQFDPSSLVEMHEISARHDAKLGDKEDSHLVTEGGGMHSSLRLFLSGESDLSHGSMLVPKSGEGANLDLHLSSEGTLCLPSDASYLCNQVKSNVLTKVLAGESISEIPVAPPGYCQGEMRDDSCNGNLPSVKYPPPPHPTKDHTNEISGFWRKSECCDRVNNGPRRRKSKGKLKTFFRTSPDTIQLKKRKGKTLQEPRLNVIDVDEAVELCIAASEAIVISELASSGCGSIVGVTLQVKHARKLCHSEVQTATANQFLETDETDQLSDLDDQDMEKTFDDVGITVTQVVSDQDESGDTCSYRTCHDNQLQVALLDTDCGGKKNSSEAYFSISDCINRTHQKKDETFKVVNDSMVGDNNIKKHMPSLFLAETSTFSESINTIGQSATVQLKSEHEIALSSRKMSEDGCSSPTNQDKRTNNTETMLSQDFVGSSNFSPIDPLCSVVPCSIIPLEMSFLCDQGIGGKSIEVVEPVSPSIPFPNSGGKDTIIEKNNVVLPSFAEMGMSDPSKFQADLCGVHIRQLNSLKTYSMAVPTGDLNLSGGTCYLKKKPLDPTLLHNITSATDSLPHKQSYCEMGEEETCFTSIIPAEDGLLHGSHKNGEHMPILPNSEHILTTTDAACFADLHNQNDKKCESPVRLYQSHHSAKLCGMTLTEQKTATFKGSSISKSKRNRRDCSEVSPCRDGTVIKSCLAYHSNPHLPSRKELNIESKRVRFSVSKPQKIQIAGPLDSLGQENGVNTKYRKNGSRRKLILMKGLESSTNLDVNDGNKMIFYGLEFLVTGFPRKKKIEVENIIRMYGGIVHPSVPRLLSSLGWKKGLQRAYGRDQIVISSNKVQTVEFLYGCAIKAWILNATWLSDSVKAGVPLPPRKYLILSNSVPDTKNLKIGQLRPNLRKEDYIFNKLSVMLHGKTSFCSKYSTIIKSGGGQVFKNLQSLIQSLKGKAAIGAIIVEDDNVVSRHLKHCALEQELHTVSVNWIVNSLFSGYLLPLKKDRSLPFHKIKMPTFPSAREFDMSEEI